MPKFVLTRNAPDRIFTFLFAKRKTVILVTNGEVYSIDARDKNSAAMQLARELVPFFEENLVEVENEKTVLL